MWISHHTAILQMEQVATIHQKQGFLRASLNMREKNTSVLAGVQNFGCITYNQSL